MSIAFLKLFFLTSLGIYFCVSVIYILLYSMKCVKSDLKNFFYLKLKLIISQWSQPFRHSSCGIESNPAVINLFLVIGICLALNLDSLLYVAFVLPRLLYTRHLFLCFCYMRFSMICFRLCCFVLF